MAKFSQNVFYLIIVYAQKSILLLSQVKRNFGGLRRYLRIRRRVILWDESVEEEKDIKKKKKR